MFADIIPGISTANAELVLVVLTFVLVAITVFLAYLTWQNVKAAKKSADDTKKLVGLTNQNVSAAKESVNATNKLIELQNEPFVYIGARWERKVIPLSPSMGGFKPPPFDLSFELLVFVQNRGGGPARNIKVVDIKDDFPTDGNYDFPTGTLDFKETPFGKGEAIKELAPGQELPLALVSRYALSLLEYSVEVVFTYENSRGKSKPGSNVLDFPSYRNSALPTY